ncbi:MAG TPA: xanthine dehydrogenase family protein subunit M [Acidimicrobiales bacterium]|nr:xanthine dehydrogenase family protein subunit M [Acidimicrobiales bacterium]
MQVPAPVEYERATSVDHALALLERHGPEARIIAGGHSLLPMMKLRLARPDVLIDINDLGELSYVRLEGDELRIGALTRHRQLLESAIAGEHFAILHDAERVIADPIVRNRGTIGGSICQADPSEDLSAVFAALKAQAVIRSSSGERVVAMDDFHQGPYTTSVGPAEILTEVRVRVRPGSGSAYEKVERRVGDWAVVAAGALLAIEGGRVSEAGIGLAAVGAEHFRAAAAEESLVGGPADEDAFARAGALAAQGCNPVGDQRGPEDFKRHLAGELTVRALRRAAARARGERG